MWAQFFKLMIAVALGTLAFLYAFVLIVDPYDTLPFSPRLDRTAVSTNQRFSYPALAASPRFDSAVFGTSTTRLLSPDDMEQAFGGQFANLSMNSATAYEQQQIFNLFMAAHPTPKTILFGIDVSWCESGAVPAKFTFRPFPPWLYDGNPWNDALFLLNFSAIEQAGRQFATLAGWRDVKYGRDGYTNFLPPQSDYDLAKVRNSLYGDGRPRPRTAVTPPPEGYAQYRRQLQFPTHVYMDAILAQLPPTTEKIFLFVPYHHFTQPAPGSREFARWSECKQRIVERAGAVENTHVLDFMILSPITGIDTNYWGPLHFTSEVASKLPSLLTAGIKLKQGQNGLFRYLPLASPSP